MTFMRLSLMVSSLFVCEESYGTIFQGDSYKGQATVSAPADLGLVHVNENLWMSQRPSTSVTGYSPCLCPSYGLLMNEIDGGFWLGLCNSPQS